MATSRGRTEKGRALAKGYQDAGWQWASQMSMLQGLQFDRPIDYSYEQYKDAGNLGSAMRLTRFKWNTWKSEHATMLFTPHPGQQAILDYLPTFPIIWLRPGQRYGKSLFLSWLAAKAIKRDPVILSDGREWLPPKGKILLGTQDRGAQRDNMDGYLQRFIPASLIANPRKHTSSPYKIDGGAIDGAIFTTGMELITRTYCAQIQSWMNVSVSMAILDELPRDPRILVEVITRCAANNGILLIAASNIYDETALTAQRLIEMEKTGLIKVVDGSSSDNPYLSKKGLDTLQSVYTDEELNIRFHGRGDLSPLKIFPSYKPTAHYLPDQIYPAGLTLATAQFLSGLDQGSPATPWAFNLFAYWLPPYPEHSSLYGVHEACVLSLADMSMPCTTTRLIECIEAIITPFRSHPNWPSMLTVVADPSIRIVNPSDGMSSYIDLAKLFNVVTPHKPELLNSFNFVNELFDKGLLFVANSSRNAHLNMLTLSKKRVSSGNVPLTGLTKDPLDALRYPLHYLHSSLAPVKINEAPYKELQRFPSYHKPNYPLSNPPPLTQPRPERKRFL